LFYLGAVLHDLGQTERFMGHQRFEVDGADAAAAFLKDKEVPAELIEVVWDAVALHTSRGIVERKRPEIALVSAGAGADVVGFGVAQASRRGHPAYLGSYMGIKYQKSTNKEKNGALEGCFQKQPSRAHFPGLSNGCGNPKKGPRTFWTRTTRSSGGAGREAFRAM
jgi:hypothetical protein